MVKQGPQFLALLSFFNLIAQMKVQHTHLMLDEWCVPLIYVWDLEQSLQYSSSLRWEEIYLLLSINALKILVVQR